MEEKFKIGKRYIVEEEGFNHSLVEIEVLEISEKAIKVKYDTKNDYWYKKENFNFKIFEELPTITRKPKEVFTPIKMKSEDN